MKRDQLAETASDSFYCPSSVSDRVRGRDFFTGKNEPHGCI